MPYSDKNEHGLITIYGDTEEETISKAIWSCIPDRDIRILKPQDKETLEQAAQNSALVIIRIESETDPNFVLSRALQESRLVVADIIAVCPDNFKMPNVEVMGKGFDLCLRDKEMFSEAFKKFMRHKVATGSRRLAGLISEEEYRRVCDALSNAPASMIVFDADKRAVFVSDHYFRAYPKIAPRLIRGLSVYDSFAMMMKEEGIPDEDPRYEKLQKFWHNLEGSIEFTLDNGRTYRLKAVRLPAQRGTVVTGQNISDYQKRAKELEKQVEKLEQQLAKAGQ